MTNTTIVGRIFTVTEQKEIKNAKGMLLARYRPGLEYTVTARILDAVNLWIDQGVAVIGSKTDAKRKSAFSIASSKSAVKGAIRISKPGTKSKVTKKETK